MPNIEVLLSVHTNSTTARILYQINPIHVIPFCFNTRLILTPLILGHLSVLFRSEYPAENLCAFLFGPLRPPDPVQFITLDLITLIILVEKHNQYGSPLCHFTHLPVICSLSDSTTFNILDECSSPNVT
jgi:hypothetical protein